MIVDGKKHHYLALKSIPTANGYNRPIESLCRLLKEQHQIMMEIFTA